MSDVTEKIISLAKRRGFVYPNSEIYGGLQGFYDFGPLGVEMKINIKRLWWENMTRSHDNVVGIDGAIITHPSVWEASGHIKSFTDPMSQCNNCHKRFKTEDLDTETCPSCSGILAPPKAFNILVKTEIGTIEGEKTTTFLRGEACQNIYLDYQNVLDSLHLKIPFGIVQIGKAFRNEITPKNFLFRQREFEQWDLQWFTHPSQSAHWFTYWLEDRVSWYKSLFQNPDRIRLKQHENLAHYAKNAVDIEYETPFGYKEMEGVHHRGDWDLGRHSEFSGKDLSYIDPISKERFLPHIIETSGGVDRTFFFLLLDAYHEEKDRVVLKLKPQISPIKVAVFPLLSNKPELVKKAEEIFRMLRPSVKTAFDDRGNIGKRYYSQDEIGTPWCVTVDFTTLEDDTVTVRERDDGSQIRVATTSLKDYILSKLSLT